MAFSVLNSSKFNQPIAFRKNITSYIKFVYRLITCLNGSRKLSFIQQRGTLLFPKVKKWDMLLKIYYNELMCVCFMYSTEGACFFLFCFVFSHPTETLLDVFQPSGAENLHLIVLVTVQSTWIFNGASIDKFMIGYHRLQ